MKRGILRPLTVVAIVAAACGGGADSSNDASEPAASTTNASAPASDSSDGEESPASTEDLVEQATEQLQNSVDTAGGMATVTIGDESWHFELSEDIPNAACDADFFGGFLAVLTSAGADLSGPADFVSVMLPGGDFTEPPSVEVTLALDADLRWIADEAKSSGPEGTGVTSFSIDNGTASGTAVFYEEQSYFVRHNNDGEFMIAEGTFEVSCVSE